jgi:phosphoglycerate dehydrogenase-like enzyme
MKVVVADSNVLPYRDILTDVCPPDTSWVFLTRFDEQEVLGHLSDADVLVASAFTQEMADCAPHLRLVNVAGAGTDGIDRGALGDRIALANTFHHGRSIAEYVAMAMVFLTRRIGTADTALRRGVWSSSVYDPTQSPPPTLRGATVGFIGFGTIGAETWHVLRGFDVRGVAIAMRPRREAELDGLRWVGGPERLGDLLDVADYVVVSVPLTADTEGMLGSAQLDRMKRSAFLMNVARGPVVEERALFEALRAGTIAGAAIDVWYSYPSQGSLALPSRLPFAALPNVLLTPHLSGVTSETFRRRAVDIGENIRNLAEGKDLSRIVAGIVR